MQDRNNFFVRSWSRLADPSEERKSVVGHPLGGLLEKPKLKQQETDYNKTKKKHEAKGDVAKMLEHTTS